MVVEPSFISRFAPDEVPYPDPAPQVEQDDRVAVEPAPVDSTTPDPRFDAIIKRVAAARGVDPTLVRAVIQVESAYEPRARSPKGAVGLMQVMPATGRQYGITNLYDPSSNIEAGVTHLRALLDRFPLTLALAAYNAGEAAVERFAGIPPYPETLDYVARIRRLVGQ
jgi:soluble lytic murein transglycosylase-like protein